MPTPHDRYVSALPKGALVVSAKLAAALMAHDCDEITFGSARRGVCAKSIAGVWHHSAGWRMLAWQGKDVRRDLGRDQHDGGWRCVDSTWLEDDDQPQCEADWRAMLDGAPCDSVIAYATLASRGVL